jgi:hypothetical protein
MVIQAFGLLQGRRVLPFVTFEVPSGVGGVEREREREILGTRCGCMNVYLMKEGRRKKWS